MSHPEPKITAPNEVRVRTIEVGICGTDREICNFAYGHGPTGWDYRLLGHAGHGEVEGVGATGAEAALVGTAWGPQRPVAWWVKHTAANWQLPALRPTFIRSNRPASAWAMAWALVPVKALSPVPTSIVSKVEPLPSLVTMPNCFHAAPMTGLSVRTNSFMMFPASCGLDLACVVLACGARGSCGGTPLGLFLTLPPGLAGARATLRRGVVNRV